MNSNGNNWLIKSEAGIAFGYSTSLFFDEYSSLSDCKFINNSLTNKITGFFYGVTVNQSLFYTQLGFDFTYSNTVKTTFNNVSFVREEEVTYSSGALPQNILFGGYNGNNAIFNRCYFGGEMRYNINNGILPPNSNNWYFSLMRGTSTANDATLIDCHLGFNLIITWETEYGGINRMVMPPYIQVLGVLLIVILDHLFYHLGITLFYPGGTDNTVNIDKIDINVVEIGNSTQLNTDQTRVELNFNNYDFDNVWIMEEGVSAPKLRSVIYNYQQYLATLPDLLIESLTINRIDSTTEEIQITISREIEDYENGILRCYISNTESEIENPENEILLIIDTENSYNGTCVLAEGIFYVLAVYENFGRV